ncbi:unnamed protein product [Gulo gulo]|uniref:Uncharacterized protein n=1 Tax=Gulo gulo TaxID=48420 RepID=A0A9X9M3Z4_GULGU|nr:unnamed protein product [Gulo gulo]
MQISAAIKNLSNDQKHRTILTETTSSRVPVILITL